METPLNVHRWRKLEGNDPTTFELLQKIQSLQKKLIARKEDIVDRDMRIADREKVCAELRATIARQPSFEAVEEVRSAKIALKKRTDAYQVTIYLQKNIFET